MKILALDTATYGCSVAVLDGDTVLARQAEKMPRGQSEALLPMVLKTLAQSGLSFADLDALAVTVGPGAFTGLRIGLAAARGLALAAKLPLIGVTTMDAVAHNVSGPDRNILVVLDAKRSDVYAQLFSKECVPLGEAVAILPEQLVDLTEGAPCLLAGDYAKVVLPSIENATLAEASGLPDPAVVARLAQKMPLPEVGDAPAPLYIRPPDAIVPKNGGRLRP